jgi:tryptophan synthase alpha chain
LEWNKAPKLPSRISEAFDRIRADKRTGLITYVTAGDPDIARSADILTALDRAGADVLEVGIPFSEPLADGPVIQRATERALAAGATAAGVLDLVARVRQAVKAPIVLFTYANPVLRMGVDAFGDRARAAGVDGVLVLDLPIEEAASFRNAMATRDIDMIFLLSPTTTDARVKEAARLGSGFLYGISRLGVTGTRATVADGAQTLAARIRAATELPIALGFGISSPEHVQQVGKFADAAVVGSGLVNVIAEAGKGPDLIERVESYVRWLTGRADGNAQLKLSPTTSTTDRR